MSTETPVPIAVKRPELGRLAGQQPPSNLERGHRAGDGPGGRSAGLGEEVRIEDEGARRRAAGAEWPPVRGQSRVLACDRNPAISAHGVDCTRPAFEPR